MELTNKNIALNEEFATKREAIEFVGQKLVECGYASVEYIDGMHDRDKQVSVYMGNDLAIPHGSDDYRKEKIGLEAYKLSMALSLTLIITTFYRAAISKPFFPHFGMPFN